MKDGSVHFGVRPHIQEMSHLEIHVLERQVGLSGPPNNSAENQNE
jgi:hypothetical protein